MKFLHYSKTWGSFKRYVVQQEIDELLKDNKLYDLAEKISFEWTVIPDDIRNDLIKTAAEAFAHDGIDKNAAEIIHLTQTSSKKALKLASDCQGAENELARLWKFLQLGDPGCTLEESSDSSSPFGAFSQIGEALTSGKITISPAEVQQQIYDTVPKNGAKKLLAKRWLASTEKVVYPQKYADADRKLSFGGKSSADKTLLNWSLAAGDPPPEFAVLKFLDPDNAVSSLKLFEIMGDLQALLSFLIRNPVHYPKYVFADYFIFGIKYYPDDLNTSELLNSAAVQPFEFSEFMTGVINLFTLKDSNSIYFLQSLTEKGDLDAATVLYAFDTSSLPDAAKILKKAANAGNISAAFFLVRDFKENNANIVKLASLSVLSDDFVNADGVKPERPFVGCRLDEDYQTWKKKIETLSTADLKRMTELWKRYAAENRFPEKLADIYAIGIFLGRKLKQPVDDFLYKATILGSLDALLELYDFFTEKNYPLYQKRLREIAIANYKLTPRQKVRLGLLKLVNV